MAYTAENLTSVESAILALASGERVVRITVKGKTMEYASVDLPQLKKLRNEIKAELNTGTRKRFTRLSVSKGL